MLLAHFSAAMPRPNRAAIAGTARAAPTGPPTMKPPTPLVASVPRLIAADSLSRGIRPESPCAISCVAVVETAFLIASFCAGV